MSTLTKINVIGGLLLVWGVVIVALNAHTIAFSRLSVEVDKTMQPFGIQAEDAVRASHALQPAILDNQLQPMQHHRFLQGSR